MIKHTLKSKRIILEVVDDIYHLLKPTYGISGKGALLDNGRESNVVDDGFKVLEAFWYDKTDKNYEFKNAVLQLIKKTTEETNRRAGDGTSTSIMLLKGMVRRLFWYDFWHGITSTEHRLKAALDEARYDIRSSSMEVKTIDHLQQIALNSFNNKRIADLVADVVWKVGADGVIRVQESDALESSVVYQEGFSFDKGFLSGFMINKENRTAELKNPYILVTDHHISAIGELVSLWEQLKEEGRSILVIAENVDGGGLQGMVVNKLNGNVTSVAVKAPFAAEKKANFLEDVAVLTGANVISFQKGMKLKDITLEDLGTASKVIVAQDKTTIIQGGGDQQVITTYLDELKKTETENDYEKDHLAKRIANFSNSIAVIKVAAFTDPERKNLMEKADDCVHATQLAFKEGMVEGAGKTFNLISTGFAPLDRAVRYPRWVLKKNGGMTGETVYDPTGVLVAALESASSIALTLVKSSGIITNVQET